MLQKNVKSYNPQKKKKLKTSAMITAKSLQQLFNQAMNIGEFPINLKNVDVTPIFNEKNPMNDGNYRPVSVLLITSKSFEKLMQNQILHVKSFFFRHTCVVTESVLIVNMVFL